MTELMFILVWWVLPALCVFLIEVIAEPIDMENWGEAEWVSYLLISVVWIIGTIHILCTIIVPFMIKKRTINIKPNSMIGIILIALAIAFTIITLSFASSVFQSYLK